MLHSPVSLTKAEIYLCNKALIFALAFQGEVAFISQEDYERRLIHTLSLHGSDLKSYCNLVRRRRVSVSDAVEVSNQKLMDDI